MNDRALAQAELQQAWEVYAHRYVTGDGRAVDSGNKGITHTEGLGVSMLVAQACGDRARFEALHQFASKLKRPDGLLSWRWEPGKGIADANNATDGDLYVAWALVRAAIRWNRIEWLEEAAALARAVRTQLKVQAQGYTVLLPGKEGFLQPSVAGGAPVPVVNLSYLILPALPDLAKADPSPDWTEIGQNTLNLLTAARFGGEKLPPDWLWLGSPLGPWSQRPPQFGYEAIRIPLFLAWARQVRHPCFLSLAQHLQQPGFAAWVNLVTGERAPYPAPTGFESVAGLVRSLAFGTPPKFGAIDGDYYSSSLSLLSRMAFLDVRPL